LPAGTRLSPAFRASPVAGNGRGACFALALALEQQEDAFHLTFQSGEYKNERSFI
jgi:hypothetical protein